MFSQYGRKLVQLGDKTAYQTLIKEAKENVRVFKGEEIEPYELVEIAIKTGADTSIKTVTAGTLQIAILVLNAKISITAKRIKSKDMLRQA